MIARLLFRVDPLTGNRMLRTGLVVGALFVAGSMIWLVVAVTTHKTKKTVDGLNLDHSDIESAGKRQIPINPEIAALVDESPEPAFRFCDSALTGASAGKNVTTEAMANVPPRFWRPSSSQTKEENAFMDGGERDPAKSGEGSAPETILPAFSSGGGACGSLPLTQSSGHTRYSAGSAVVFKRQEDSVIQKRDSSAALNEPGLTAGTVIVGQLLTGIVSGAPLPVMLRIRDDVVHKGLIVIPAGTILLGTSQANYEARRIFVTIDRLILGDSEINICGSISDSKGRSGLCDRYIDTARQQLLPAFFAGVLGEFGRAFSACVTSSRPIPVLEGTANRVESAFLAGTSSGLDAVAQTLAAKAKEAKAVIIAYPDQIVQVVLTDKIQLEILLQAIRGR